MKKIIIFIFLALLILDIGCGNKSENPMRFGYKSGIVSYAINNELQYLFVYYFDDYGNKEALFSPIMLMGEKGEFWKINANGYLINFNKSTKTGTKEKSTGFLGAPYPMPVFSKMDARAGIDYKELGEDMFQGKKVQGYSCRKIISGSNTYHEIWLHENIPFMAKMTFPDEPRAGSLALEEKKIELGVPVPDEVFKVPADVKIDEVKR